MEAAVKCFLVICGNYQILSVPVAAVGNGSDLVELCLSAFHVHCVKRVIR